MVSRSIDWIRQASRNLASAHANYEKELYEGSCFESHQVGEKAVKGLLNNLHRGRRGTPLPFYYWIRVLKYQEILGIVL